jgi:predicted TIM-barrel fold metal-dependent hydrolase
MRWNDALVYLGRDRPLAAFQQSDPAALGRMLDRYGIDRAVVYSFPYAGRGVLGGNEQAFAAAAAEPRLVPCPAVLPDSGLEVGDEVAFVAGLVRRGARCACLYPQTFGTGLHRRIIGRLLRALEDRRLPVALFETELPDAVDLAADYPGLPILVHTPMYRDRRLLPLLRETPNLYISIAPRFAPFRGLEVLVRECGVERILFASGFPVAEPGAAMAYLLGSGLTDEQVERIAGANLDQLMAAVRVDGSDDAPSAATSGEPAGEPAGRIGGVCEAVFERRPLPWAGVVDMHAHLGPGTAFPMWCDRADDLVAEMDRAGVERIFLSHTGGLGAEAVWGNDQLLAAMRRHPGRILGYATCYPLWEPTGVAEVQRCIEAGMRGVKLHNSRGMAYTDERYAPVWQYAHERGLPVLLHTWGGIEALEPLFERYRRAQILLGHAGAAEPEVYVRFARRYPNLWLELANSHSPYGLVEYFVGEVGPERVLWGSDAPWMSIHQQLGRVLFADIPDAQKHTILVDNPRRLLSLP